MTVDFIEEIRALAKEGQRIDPECRIFGADRHHWQFGEKANMREIQAFERDMHIELPEPLIRYLTELGNGGAGPDYGIYSLDEMRRRNPSLPQQANLPVMLDHTRSSEEWIAFARRIEALDEQIDLVSGEDWKPLAEAQSQLERQVIVGGLFIGTPGCTMMSLLMGRGAARGEVFVIDFDYLSELTEEPYCCGRFEDWMLTTMKRSLHID